MANSAEASASGVWKGMASLMTRARWAAGLAAAMGFAMATATGSVLAQDAPAPFGAPPEAPAAAPQGPPPPLAETVVATVNDDVISSYDLSQRMRLLMITSGVQ